jgi:hypothetical protein
LINQKIKRYDSEKLLHLCTIIAIGFGIPLLFFPQLMIDIYAVQKTEVTGILDLASRGYGSLLIALGIACFAIRNTQSVQVRRAFLLMLAISNPLTLIVHIRAIMQNTENSMGWGTVLCLGILTA